MIARRIYLLIFHPRAEWEEIAREPMGADTLIRRYILPLSLIPPIATVIGMKTFDASWDPACGTAGDFAVYEGALGSWYSHEAIACTTGGILTATFAPAERGTYYLVAPLHDNVEGNCGRDSSGTQRPPAAARCGGDGSIRQSVPSASHGPTPDLPPRCQPSRARIKAYELGERSIPLPELEVLVSTLGGRIESFFDRSGPIGQWLINEEAFQNFLELPDELRKFVAQPVNRPTWNWR